MVAAANGIVRNCEATRTIIGGSGVPSGTDAAMSSA